MNLPPLPELPELPEKRHICGDGFEDFYFAAAEVRAYALSYGRAVQEACAREVEAMATQAWDAAMGIQPPSDRAGQLAHISVVMRERAAAIRNGVLREGEGK